MWAFIGSGKISICKSQVELNKLIAIYPYAKYQYCETESDCLIWFRRHQRGAYSTRPYKFGNIASKGYITVEYFIDGKNLYYNLDISKYGRILVVPDADEGIIVDNRKELIKVKVENVILNDSLITHHLIAIQRLMYILGDYCDLEYILPDMSIYLALTAYSGKDATIRRIQDFIKNRLGGVAYTVKDY